MKTKTVEMWCDLWPGWQDSNQDGICVFSRPLANKQHNTKRIKVIVELPCFGGSAEQDAVVVAKTEVANDEP